MRVARFGAGRVGLDLDRSGQSITRPALAEDGAGPVERLFRSVAADPGITEILINGPGPIWVERFGQLEQTPFALDARALTLLIEAIVAPLGLRVDRSSPIVDARLADGSRVNVVVPPLTVGGPAVSIRRFHRQPLTLDAFGPPELVAILERLVARPASILVVGPTNSGKTSLVAALAARIDPGERLVCIEDPAELVLDRHNLVRLEARPANSEGVGEVTIRQLVLTALRMRPDRVIVGEVRGAEAFDLLLAMTSGHRGSLSTIHAADAAAGIRRLETLASLAEPGLSARRIRHLVFDGIDAVVVTGRTGPGRRVIQVAQLDQGQMVGCWPAPPRFR